MKIIFFGSFLHYSTLVLEELVDHPDIDVIGVVTTPPQPAGRKKVLKPTHTHTFAKKHHIPVITPEKLDKLSLKEILNSYLVPRTSTIKSTDFFVTAGYGKLLPAEYLKAPKLDALNLHFSLLPKYRGANPGEWAILLGEKETGVTLISMSPKFDTGAIIAQSPIKISKQETRETLYQKLYTVGAGVLPTMLIDYYNWKQKSGKDCQISLAPQPQIDESPTPYAWRLKREDGFIPWPTTQKAMTGKPLNETDLDSKLFNDIHAYFQHQHTKMNQRHFLTLIERFIRALSGYPGAWTEVETPKGKKRLKLLSAHLADGKLHLDQVQLEGQQPAAFNQIKSSITINLHPTQIALDNPD